jgi:hypothetical protein
VSASSRATALALAAIGAAGADAPSLLARVAGPHAAAARAEATRLLALPPAALAAEAARVRAPRPPGLDRVHPDWLGSLSETGPGSLSETARVWAERRAYGGLVAMPERQVEQVRVPEDLPYARADWLIARFERVGLRQLAHATATAPKAELAALAARLGPRGRAFVDGVKRILELGEGAADVLGPRRAAQARCAGVKVGEDPMAFLAIGARAIAPHLGGDLPWQIAQRLPRAPGERVLAEMINWQNYSISESSPWTELTRA